MTQTTKLLHINGYTHPGNHNAHVLCGRMVNRLSVLHPDEADRATCPKCITKAALQLATVPA